MTRHLRDDSISLNSKKKNASILFWVMKNTLHTIYPFRFYLNLANVEIVKLFFQINSLECENKALVIGKKNANKQV